MYDKFCRTAKESAKRAKALKSFQEPSSKKEKKKKIREPSPEPDPAYDEDEAWKESEYEASDEENDADEEMAKEIAEIDPTELDEMWKDAGIPRWKPLEPFKPKRAVPRPPKGYAPIKLEAWHDTSPAPRSQG
jgi:hypothetical protein